MRRNVNTKHRGRIKVVGKRSKPAKGVMIHYCVGTQNGNVADCVLQDVKYGVGYAAIIDGDIVYPLVDDMARDIVSHARGFNTSHVGLGIAYPGPQFSAREGWTRGVHAKTQRTCWVPPYPFKEIETLANEVKRLRAAGVGLEVRYHEDEDPEKSDPGDAFPRALFELLLSDTKETR